MLSDEIRPSRDGVTKRERMVSVLDWEHNFLLDGGFRFLLTLHVQVHVALTVALNLDKIFVPQKRTKDFPRLIWLGLLRIIPQISFGVEKRVV